MAVKCCYGCTPPKRSPYCHGTCEEYINAKAAHDEEQAAMKKAMDIQRGLDSQTIRGVIRGKKRRR